jgi:hypothetical protein
MSPLCAPPKLNPVSCFLFPPGLKVLQFYGRTKFIAVQRILAVSIFHLPDLEDCCIRKVLPGMLSEVECLKANLVGYLRDCSSQADSFW